MNDQYIVQAELAEINPNSLPDQLDGYSLVPTLKGIKQDQPEYVHSMGILLVKYTYRTLGIV